MRRDAFHIGQRLYKVHVERARISEEWAVVTKIGRKWVTTETGDRYKFESRFDADTMVGEGYNPARYYFSEVAHREWKLTQQAWGRARSAMQKSWNMPKNFTVEKARQLCSILEMPWEEPV